ncbi:MAG: hypothetical protein ACREP6_10155, partial [Candidatus Binataceae bacterium]
MSGPENPLPTDAVAAKRPVNRARIERIFDHNDDTRSLFLRVIEGRLAPFVPGQFISLSIVLENETRTR